MPDPLPHGRGRPLPLGASRAFDGTNFAVLSRHATRVSLVLLPEGDGPPLAELPLDERHNRTGDHWHIRVDNLPDVFRYGWRVDGPTGGRHRFDPTRILIDPASTLVSDAAGWAATCEADPERTGRRSLFVRATPYDWEDDRPPLTPHEDIVVYEVHVRGFTRHPSSGVADPGTFRGLIDKLPYLRDLGVTALELLPIHEFDECDCPFTDPESGAKLVNFWGYNSIAFAAPKAGFAATGPQHGQATEFRDLVKAAHRHGIEVYLDVVFNHTGEGDDRGRTFSFRGLDNGLYYLMDERGGYLNFSGCGNTLNCNHPLVRELILTCLRYWVGTMHVDGFRFDLASILGRDRFGRVMVEPPVIEAIAEDGVLADTKLIAEPWDAAGLYQVGGFPYGRRWSEWNGKYRDDVRDFWRGTPGVTAALATRLCGSADLYQRGGRLPRHSLNFLTCHDGFTLWDLVSYDQKHNQANGEDGRDGTDDNRSWNSGHEGPTDDPAITELRVRRAKGLMATLLLSQGVPMLLAGDEFLRTQHGNNNAWCQDNAISWVDWTLADRQADFLRFTRELIGLRRQHPVFRRRRFLVGDLGPATVVAPVGVRTPAAEASGRPVADVQWHGAEPYRPDFGPDARLLGYTLDGRFTGRDGDPDYHPDRDFYLLLSNSHEPTAVVVPPSPTGRRWRRLIDTGEASPRDVRADDKGTLVKPRATLEVAAFGLVVLMSEA